MDLPATQVFDDDDLPTQKYSEDCQDKESKQIAMLIINLVPHVIKKGVNKIGRHPACDIIINDQTVSKHHAEIEADADGKSLWICDLNSSNKTKLNDVPLRANRNYELKHESVIEFGKVRAIFEIRENMEMDSSTVPATPGPANRKQVLQVIPSTPDSSLNNSSTLEEDISSIPGTQTDELDSVFRRPSLPRQRHSDERSRRSILHDSSLDDSADNTRVCTVLRKSTASDQSDDVNIFDMETQKLDANYSSDDIHDVATQRICTDVDVRRKSIRELRRSEDIHEVETQDASKTIHEMDTQKQRDVHNASAKNVSHVVFDVETQEAEDDIQEVETQKLHDVHTRRQSTSKRRTSNLVDTAENSRIEKRKHLTDEYDVTMEVASNAEVKSNNDNNERENDFIRLTLTPNFEDEVNQLDVSDFRGSPNLVEGYFEEARSSPNERQSHSKESNDTSKSSDEENIFEAETQQIKNTPSSKGENYEEADGISSRKGIIHIPDSGSDTDDEVIQFQSIKVAKEPAKSDKNQNEDSESSETDEEGQFAEYSKRQNQVTSSPLKRKERSNEGNKSDPSTSVESDDIFEMATQRVVTDEDRESEDTASSKMIGRKSLRQKITTNKIDIVDDMAPTQVINDATDDDTSKRKDDRSNVQEANIDKDDDIEIDDLTPTQIINVPEDSEEVKNRTGPRSSVSKTKDSEQQEDETEIDMLPTQIIDTQQKSTLIDESSSDSSYEDRGETPIQHGSIENISYEMASTQVIDDAEDVPKKKLPTRKSGSKVTLRKSTKSSKDRKSVLNDTLERNLDNMFGGATRRSTRKPSVLSTQSLQDVLQTSQDDRELLDIAVASGKIPAIKDARVVLVKELRPSGNSTPIPDRSTSNTPNFSTESTSKTRSNKDSVKRPSIQKIPIRTMSMDRRQSRKVNLNDTIEKNLINMFDDVNEDIEEPPHISTQCLEDVLQMSQTNAEVSDNNDTSTTKVTKKTMESNKKNTSLTNKSASRRTRSSLKEDEINVDSLNSDANISGVTTTRKRTLLRDSKDSVNAPKVAKQQEKDATNTQVTVVETNSPVLAARERRSSQRQTTVNVKSETATSKKTDESDDEFMASLPVAKVSGTLSNPTSPSVSSKSAGRDNRKTRNSGKKGSTKKKVPSIIEYLTEDSKPYHTVSSPKISMKVGKIDDSDDDKIYKKLKIIAGRLLSVKPKYIDKKTVFSLDDSDISIGTEDIAAAMEIHQPSGIEQKQPESVDSSTRRSTSDHSNSGENSPSLQSSKTARQPRRTNDERSRVFQVGTENAADKVTAKSGGKKQQSKSNAKEKVRSRGKKRSLSTVDKSKEDAGQKRLKVLDTEEKEVATEPAKTRNAAKITLNRKSESKSILNYLTRSAPSRNTRTRASTESSSTQEPLSKSTKSNTAKVSLEKTNNIVGTKNEANNSPIPRLNIKRIRLKNGETQFSSRSFAPVSMQDNASEYTKLDVKTVEMNSSKRITRAANVTPTSDSGAESQEVEMIMKSASNNAARSVRSTRAKSKKRLNSKDDEETATTDNNWPDEHQFEAPTTKPKRGKSTRQNSQSSTSLLEEEPKPQPRSLRSSRASGKNSSAVESTDGESLDSSAEQKSRSTRSKAAPKAASKAASKAKKDGQGKIDANASRKTDTDTNTSSSVDSSMDTTAFNSTISRIRRSMSFMNTGSPLKTKRRVLFTGITDAEYSNILKKLDGEQVEDHTKCDVLVTDKVRRTVKFLCALAQSTPIVSLDWLTESETAGRLLDWEGFILKDPAAEAKFGFKLRKSLEKSKQKKLLSGYTILLTPKVAPPPISEFKAMILSCGGKVLLRPPTKWTANTVIVSREEDTDNAQKFLSKAPKSVTVQSTEFILTGILRQELDFVKNKLL